MHSFVQIQSETNPKIEYNIHLENGIPMSCSCKDFLYSSKKDCKHMIEYTRHHTRQFLTSMKMCQQTLLADGSLHQRVSAIEQELFNLKIMKKSGQLTDTSQFKKIKKQIASLLTKERLEKNA